MRMLEWLKTRDQAPWLLWPLWATWILFFISALVTFFQSQPPLPRLIATLVGASLFFALYLWATLDNIKQRVLVSPLPNDVNARSWLILGVMMVSCLALPLLAHETQGEWLDPFIFTSAYAGGRLPPARFVPTLLLLLAIDLVGGPLIGFSWADLGRSVIYIVVVGVVVHILVRVISNSRELRQARREIARLAVQAERLRLSRDLHDSVKQHIFAASLQIGTALSLIERNGEAARRHLTEAETLVFQAQQDLTALIQDLRPSVLEEKGLPAALEDFVTTWSRQNAIVADVSIAQLPQLPHVVEEALWRVAQEALSNVARHSQAGKVHLHLDATRGEVRLSLADDGLGFEAGACQQVGVGLSSIHERIEALGGSVFMESRPGEGTRLVVRCPLPPKGPATRTGALSPRELPTAVERQART